MRVILLFAELPGSYSTDLACTLVATVIKGAQLLEAEGEISMNSTFSFQNAVASVAAGTDEHW
jgi:hypothetical protein